MPARCQAGDVDLVIHEGHCGGTAFDAMLYVQRWGERPRLALEYATAVLDSEEATGLIESFEATLRGLGTDPDRPVAEASSVSARQEALVLGWGRGAPADVDRGLWQLVAENAARRPSAVAVHDEHQHLTYAELIVRAERLAAVLAGAGVPAGDHVIVAVPRSVEEIVAIVAVLRLGAVYVGLDEHAPPAQVDAIMRIAHPRATIAVDGGPLRERLPDGCALVDPRRADGDPAALPAPLAINPDRPVYTSFTSGSTGEPKGVRIAERGVVRLVRDAADIRQGPQECFLRLSPLAFDASTLEIFAPLVSGGRIEVHPASPVSPDGLAEVLVQGGVTVLWLTAGLFRLVADHRPDAFRSVRQVLTGGDVVPARQVRRVLEHNPGLRVTNGYGPTENTTFTAVHHVDSGPAVEEPLPIGRPVPGTDVLVLDRTGRLLPPGSVGDLWTGGHGLALDYLRNPGATAAAFGSPPAVGGKRLYRTGDLVVWDHAGRLRFLGRADRQVKVNGHRVELEATERALREHDRVGDAVVAVTGADAQSRIVAGVVAEPGAVTAEALHRHLAERLPSYALPALVAVVDRLPVTPNGKVDVDALCAAALAGTTPAGSGEVPPDDTGPARPTGPVPIDVTELVMGVWADVLGTDEFGPDKGFFDVGGDSLKLAEVRNRLREELPACRLSTVELYRLPTVMALAEHLDRLVHASARRR